MVIKSYSCTSQTTPLQIKLLMSLGCSYRSTTCSCIHFLAWFHFIWLYLFKLSYSVFAWDIQVLLCSVRLYIGDLENSLNGFYTCIDIVLASGKVSWITFNVCRWFASFVQWWHRPLNLIQFFEEFCSQWQLRVES